MEYDPNGNLKSLPHKEVCAGLWASSWTRDTAAQSQSICCTQKSTADEPCFNMSMTWPPFLLVLNWLNISSLYLQCQSTNNIPVIVFQKYDQVHRSIKPDMNTRRNMYKWNIGTISKSMKAAIRRPVYHESQGQEKKSSHMVALTHPSDLYCRPGQETNT